MLVGISTNIHTTNAQNIRLSCAPVHPCGPTGLKKDTVFLEQMLYLIVKHETKWMLFIGFSFFPSTLYLQFNLFVTVVFLSSVLLFFTSQDTPNYALDRLEASSNLACAFDGGGAVSQKRSSLIRPWNLLYYSNWTGHYKIQYLQVRKFYYACLCYSANILRGYGTV